MTCDDSLKLRLAQELPTLIQCKQSLADPIDSLDVFPRYTDMSFFWIDTNKEITNREWNWVINHAVTKKGHSFIGRWAKELQNINDNFGHDLDVSLTDSTWQQQTMAYFKIKDLRQI